MWDETTYPFPSFNGSSHTLLEIRLLTHAGIKINSVKGVLDKWAPDKQLI